MQGNGMQGKGREEKERKGKTTEGKGTEGKGWQGMKAKELYLLISLRCHAAVNHNVFAREPHFPRTTVCEPLV